MILSTRYTGPDAAGVGARIRVRVLGVPGQALPQATGTFPFDYAARDPHQAAVLRFVTEKLGWAEATVSQVEGDGYRYEAVQA